MQPTYNSVISVTLGELRDAGAFDFENDEKLLWNFYNNDQFLRVSEKILARYKYRDIGVLPYAKWRDAYVRRMNEIMPKYKALYKALDDGTDILQTSDDFEKSSEVYSSFPQTQLSDNQDYADSMRENQREHVTLGDWIDKSNAVAKNYNDVDVMILDELETLFSCLFSVSINGF